MNLPVANLALITTPKGEYLSAKQVIRGRSAKEILEDMLPRAVAEIPWPRSMYWTGAEGLAFYSPDPLGRGAAWAASRCGSTWAMPWREMLSSGHRFLGKAKIPVSGAKDYVQKLKANYVLVRPEDRKSKIEGELRRLASGKGLRIHEDAHLMDMVTYLNEYPTAILGGFDPSFLELPEEILITVMRGHQKYFALERKDGTLAPNFLAVINLDKDKAGLIRAGHERVLRARFADARFFWETDQKCRLADYLPKLGGGHLSGKAWQLRRQGRAHARTGSLALRAMVRQRNSARQRRCRRSRGGTFQVRLGHRDGSRVHGTSGNCWRPLRKISRRT